MTDLRLLKVHVQPIFVVVTDDGVTEVPGEPIVVAGKDWPAFGAASFSPDDLVKLAEQLDT